MKYTKKYTMKIMMKNIKNLHYYERTFARKYQREENNKTLTVFVEILKSVEFST